MKKITIYTTSTCPYCQMAKEYLKQEKLAYTEVDISKNPDKAQEMIQKSKQMGVPVLVIGKTIIVGFDKEAIKKALK